MKIYLKRNFERKAIKCGSREGLGPHKLSKTQKIAQKSARNRNPLFFKFLLILALWIDLVHTSMNWANLTINDSPSNLSLSSRNIRFSIFNNSNMGTQNSIVSKSKPKNSIKDLIGATYTHISS